MLPCVGVLRYEFLLIGLSVPLDIDGHFFCVYVPLNGLSEHPLIQNLDIRTTSFTGQPRNVFLNEALTHKPTALVF